MAPALATIPITGDQLRQRIGRVPRVRLAHLPTPLEELPRLSRALGGPRLFAKRDDLTGLAFGGNKVRNLEFRLAEVLEAKADTVIMFVDVLSNSARQTTAAANRFGLKTVLVLKRPPDEGPGQPASSRPFGPVTGNLLVDYLLGAEVLFAADTDEQRRLADEAAERSRREGHHPFILNDSPMFAVAAALAYAEATLELLDQLAPLGVGTERLHLYISSSGKGQPGPELATRALGLATKVHGASVARTDGRAKRAIAQGVTNAARFLGLQLAVGADDVDNRDDYVGPGYGIPSEPGLEAMHLAARTDGLLLDPVYTGKAFAAIIDDIRRGRLGPADTAVFIHTGGLPLIFNLAEEVGRSIL